METKTKIEDILSQYYGTELYHYNPFTLSANMVYTDGVKAMAELCQAWWLIDVIASHQRQCLADESLRFMQFWSLRVNQDRSAEVICERDHDDVYLTQKIEYTDFPLSGIKVWLERGSVSVNGTTREMMIAMLPSER